MNHSQRRVVAAFIATLLIFLLVSSCRQSPTVQISTNFQKLQNELESIQKKKFDQRPCRLLIDKARGLSWINFEKTENQNQFAFCLGLLHGKDRTWQMQLLKEIAQGRRSERTSFKDVKRDYFFRMLNLESESHRLYLKARPQFKSYLLHYALGVNSGFLEALKKKQKSKQWKVYPAHSLEAWNPEDSLMVLLLQSLDQTKKTFEQDGIEEEWIQNFGYQWVKEALETSLPWDAPILTSPDAQSSSKTEGQSDVHPRNIAGHQKVQVFESEQTGSNSWIVRNGILSRDHAYLANDPHLSLQRPPLWYLTGVSIGKIPLRFGVTVPGIPIIASGANRNVVWGITNAYAKFGRIIEIAQKSARTETFKPVVWFQWLGLKIPIFWKKMTRTEAGWPVLPSTTSMNKNESDQTMRILIWSGLLVRADEVEAMFHLHHSKSAKELDQTLKEADIPGWNIVFADRKGAAGYRMMGKLIDWRPGFGISKNPVILSQRSDRSLDWMNDRNQLPIVPLEKRPHVFWNSADWTAPYLVTANQIQYSRGKAKTWLGSAHVESFRAFRINELLSKLVLKQASNSESQENISQMRKIQCDIKASDAPFLFPVFEEIFKKDPRNAEWLQSIASWIEAGAKVTKDCEPCVFYEVLREKTLQTFGLNTRTLYLLWRQKSQFLYSQEADHLWKEVLESTRDWTRKKNWENLHFASFSDLLGNHWFPKGTLPTSGGEHSVNPGTWKFQEEKNILEHQSGASWRLIAQISQTIRLYFQTSGPNVSDELGIEKIRSSQRWKDWGDCENYLEVDFETVMNDLREENFP